MCFIAKKQRVKTAKEDMRVWKVLIDGTKSSLMKFEYEPEKLYEAKMVKITAKTFNRDRIKNFDNQTGRYIATISEGLGCLSKYDSKLIYINQAFHSIKTHNRAVNVAEQFTYGSVQIKEFTIPKGAKYYEDGTNLLVSDKIIMKGE